MRPRSRILLALVLLVLLALLGAFARLPLRPREPDPLYNGKPLSYWLQGYSYNFSRGTQTPAPTRAEALASVQHLGTNAIPTLLRLLKTRDDPLITRFWQLTQKQHLIHVHYTPPQTLIDEAFEGFEVLGSKARPIIPQLIEIFTQNPSLKSRQMIPGILANLYAPGKSVVPLLVRGTTDTNVFVRHNSVSALGSIHAEPDLAVPALIKALDDPSDMIRKNAAYALAAYGGAARPAVPALLKLLAREQTNPATDSSPHISNVGASDFTYIFGSPPSAGTKSRGAFNVDVLTSTIDALKIIDPQAAAQAGIK